MLYEDPKISGLGSEFVSAFDTRKSISQINQMRRRRGQGGEGGKVIIKRTSIVTTIVVFICAISLFFTFSHSKYLSFFLIFNDNRHPASSVRAEIGMDELSTGWRPSSAPRVDWPSPPYESNGYLCIRSYADLIEQRNQICNAVFVARIMNATLVLPDLCYLSWQVEGGFQGIYDVKHFINSLRNDIQIVESLPEIYTHGNMKAYKMWIPGMYAPRNWYTTIALEKMKKHGAISINAPSSYHFKEGIFINEYQRLRCRVNYHALRFKPQLMKLSKMIVSKLRSHGNFVAIQEMDRLQFGMCYEGILTPEDSIFLPHRALMPGERRDPCPLTPEMVGLILRAMGFDNSTRIYLVGGEFFGGEHYMKPFLELFPHLENQKTVIPVNELSENNTHWLQSVVDYMVSLQADIFMSTHTGSSKFATTVLDHRLYYGFPTTIQADMEALGPIFVDREEKKGNETATSSSALASFEEAVRHVMFKTSKFGGAQERGRVRGESSFINPWPDCFCQISAPKNSADYCPPGENLTKVVNSFFFLKKK